MTLRSLLSSAMRQALGPDSKPNLSGRWPRAQIERAADKLSMAGEPDAVNDMARLFGSALRLLPALYSGMEDNGERELVRRLAPFAPKVVFDVGANHGEWSAMALAHFPHAHIHAFEIVPATGKHLHARMDGVSAVTINDFGLSSADGMLDINYFDGNDQVASLAPMPHVGNRSVISCPVRAGDAYVAEKGIAHIDLMKIDVEGAEPLVLEGFAKTLAAGAIDVIQFEYGHVNILTHRLLLDFHIQLGQYGYRVGKLWPSGVAFADYRFEDEDFVHSNHIACRLARPDLIAALQANE